LEEIVVFHLLYLDRKRKLLSSHRLQR